MKAILRQLRAVFFIGSVFSLALLEPGCVDPSQQEALLAPSATANRDAGGFPDQSVTVVLSQHAKNALDFLAARSGEFGAPPDISPTREVLDRLKRVLAANFKSYELVTDPSQPHAEADLTLVLDIRVTLGRMSGQTNLVELQGTFVDHNQQPYETVTGAGNSIIPWPAFQTRFSQAAGAAFAQFGSNLRAIPRDKLSDRGSATHSPGALPGNPEL